MEHALLAMQVLLDDDVVPGPGLVEAYVRAAARNKQVRACEQQGVVCASQQRCCWWWLWWWRQ